MMRGREEKAVDEHNEKINYKDNAYLLRNKQCILTHLMPTTTPTLIKVLTTLLSSQAQKKLESARRDNVRVRVGQLRVSMRVG